MYRPDKRFSVLSMAFAMVLVAGCGSKQPGEGTTSDGTTTSGGGGEPTADDYYEHYMSETGMALAEDRLEDALDAYLEAAATLDGTGEVTVKRAEAHFLAADMAYQRVDKDLAIEQYQLSVDIYLRFTGNSRVKAAVALTNMGVIYKEKAEKNKARNCWEQALQIYKEAPSTSKVNIHIRKVQQNIRDLDHGF